MSGKIIALCLIIICAQSSFGHNNFQSTAPPVYQLALSQLNELPQQINSIDEPAIRVFLRLQIAKFLLKQLSKEMNPALIPSESLIQAALNDLSEHEEEIPELYLNSMRSESMTLLRTHFPDAAKRLNNKYISEDKRQPEFDFDIASSLLEEKGQADSAVNLVQQALLTGYDPGAKMFFFLLELQKEKPAQLSRLLNNILIIEHQKPNSVSIETLFWLKAFYLQQETPIEIKKAFIKTVINSLEKISVTQAIQSIPALPAYKLLQSLQPVAFSATPDIYTRIEALMAYLQARIPQQAFAQIEIQNRIDSSDDPINELLYEARNIESTYLKENLLAQAAQLARDRGQMKLAFEIAEQISGETDMANWKDQFFSEIVDSAIQKEDLHWAELADSRISSVQIRVSTMQKIALYLFRKNDIIRSREILNEAVRINEKSPESGDKANGYLDLAQAFTKVDELRIAEMIQLAIKNINNIPCPKLEERSNLKIRKTYAELTIQIFMRLMPVIERLPVKDDDLALTIASNFDRQEMKIAAKLAVSVGILAAKAKSDSAKH